MRTPARFLLLSAALLAVPSSALATNLDVEIVNFQFVPSSLPVAVGDSVTWRNTVATTHTVTSGTNCTADGLFNSGSLGLNDTFGLRFNDLGDFPYFCSPHCDASDMTGIIVVSEDNPATLVNTWGQIRALYR